MNRTVLKEALAALTADALTDVEHPSPEELLAYHAEELESGAYSRLQEHLAWCSECNSAVRDLASWSHVALHDSSLERTRDEEAADWQTIQLRIAKSAGKGIAAPVAKTIEPIHVSLPRPSSPSVPRSYSLLAAALMIAALSFYVFRLSPRMEPSTPQTNIFVADLVPNGKMATRQQGVFRETRTDVPAGMETVVFLLVQKDFRSFDDHEVELLNEAGTVFWQTDGLVSPPEGGFSVAVPLRSLHSSLIEVRLYGVHGQNRDLLATYSTRIHQTAKD